MLSLWRRPASFRRNAAARSPKPVRSARAAAVRIVRSSRSSETPFRAARDFKRVEEHFGDSSNSWTAFDGLVTAAHNAGIKVIVDFAPNHSNDNNGGEYGSLYDAGRAILEGARDFSGGCFKDDACLILARRR